MVTFPALVVFTLLVAFVAGLVGRVGCLQQQQHGYCILLSEVIIYLGVVIALFVWEGLLMVLLAISFEGGFNPLLIIFDIILLPLIIDCKDGQLL